MTERDPLPVVISTGNRRASLEAIRDHLAVELTTCEDKQTASIAKELRAVIAELDSLPLDREVSSVDRIADARARRRAARGTAVS